MMYIYIYIYIYIYDTYTHFHFYLFICQWTFQMITYLMLQWKYDWTYLFNMPLSFSLAMYTELGSHGISTCYFFHEPPLYVLECCYLFTYPTLYKKYIFPTFSPILTFPLFNMDILAIWSNRALWFFFHFPGDQWCWTFFHIPIGHLYFFWEKFIQNCPFLIIFCVLAI
jgi:hypothetical protein